MSLKTTQLRDAIAIALAVGVTSFAGSAFAQDSSSNDQEEQQQEATTLDRIEVTGSRIKRADIEGALPVTVIDRAQIDASGDVSVADVLRDTTFSSFGNFRPQSGSSAQALADIDLRGLGSARTLVLIDGRRAPKAPFAAGSQDLNSIPIAAVERIEILSDGASAVYGSDAIGGVVNIVLRKDFEGAEIRYGIGQTSVKGGDTQEGAALFGTSGERGRLLAGVSTSERGMVYTRDQIGYAQGVSVYGNNYRVYNQDTGAFVTAPTAVPGFACNSDGFYLTAGGTCSFDFNAVAANEAQIKNKGLFARGEYDINDDWSIYMTSMATNTTSFGRYAPTPALFVVADGTPNDIVQGDGLSTALYHRLAAFGNRDTYTDSTLTDLNLGVSGMLGETAQLDAGIRFSDYKYNERGTGYTVNPLLVAAAESGAYDVRDPFAQPLPDVTATIGRNSRYRVEELYSIANFDLFEMGGGTSNAAIGFEHRKETYYDIYDALSEAGLIDGSAGNSAGGDRQVNSAFFEWLFPIVTNFDITLAGRYDRYSDYGADFSPKIAFRWQPLDNLTLRGSYGTGFRAPPLDLITAETTFSAESVIDPPTCQVFGGSAAQCQTAGVQVDTYYIANPDLGSEQSTQFALGVAYDPTDWLNVTLDYYNIEIEDRIRAFDAQTLIDRSNGVEEGNIPSGLGVTRAADGSIVRVDAGYGNEGDLTTDGLDLNLRTRFETDMGRLQNHLQVSYVNSYKIDEFEYAGVLGSPDLRANLSNSWTTGDWSFGVISRFIAGQETSAARRVGGYSTHDAFVTVKLPWNAQATVGANNIGDRYPELVNFSGRPWNFALYDAYGRSVYFRYTQRF